MAKSTVITIGPRDRYWAHPPAERSWQRFWGKFERQATTGLYVECGSDPTHLKNLASAFHKLPTQLQETCLDWRVTFNFAAFCTASGNSSTFYADFSKKTREEISPHVEMGRTSLQPTYILAHLGHELSHLYWRTRTEDEKNLYRQFLRETCGKGTVEITTYVQERFAQHLKVVNGRDKATLGWSKANIFESWAEESFCDTVAVLVAPDYPSYDRNSSVNLATRKMVICSTFGLTLPPIANQARATVLTQ